MVRKSCLSLYQPRILPYTYIVCKYDLKNVFCFFFEFPFLFQVRLSKTHVYDRDSGFIWSKSISAFDQYSAVIINSAASFNPGLIRLYRICWTERSPNMLHLWEIWRLNQTKLISSKGAPFEINMPKELWFNISIYWPN